MSSSIITPEWRQGEFLITTSQDLLQPHVVNTAFASEYMYWTKAMTEEGMKKMLRNSLCFGVYALPESASQQSVPTQIGLARLITDQSTFAYITDVFVLPDYQGRGLGKWLMQCINETLDTWPDLRAAMLYASGETALAFYRETLGMKTFKSGRHGLEIMNKRGPGDVFPEEDE